MSSNTIRVGASIPLAIVVTIALFWLMNYLITHGMDAITEEVQGSAIDFTRVDRDETVQAKDRALPDRPDKPDAPPPPPPMNLNANTAPDSGGLGINAPAFSRGLNLDRAGLAAPTDGDAIPLVRVPPQYPQRAASRGVNGWVQLEFTITETGGVEDIMVIAAEPTGYFERAAERALARWKYKPKIVDGRPARRYNNQVVITFELED
ncbi:MAG: energy transducer TonB [Rhodospirillaceae bacterium]